VLGEAGDPVSRRELLAALGITPDIQGSRSATAPHPGPARQLRQIFFEE